MTTVVLWGSITTMNTLLEINNAILGPAIDFIKLVGWNSETEELNLLGVILILLLYVVTFLFYAIIIAVLPAAIFLFVLDTFVFEGSGIWYAAKCNIFTFLECSR